MHAAYFVKMDILLISPFLDHSPKNYGYAVFVKVVQGLDIVETINKVKTATIHPYQNVPVEDVLIKKVSIIKK